MSMCFRTVPCKLTSLVGHRNQIVQRDRRLTKFIATTASLQENSRVPSKQILNELSLTATQYKTSIGFKNLGISLYSTAPGLSKKSVKTSAGDKYSEATINDSKNKRDEPSKQQLEHVYKTLEHDLPAFFVASIDYRIYHKDIEFMNNYKGTKTQGINNYIKQVLYLRTTGHIVYAYVKFDVLKITMHPEDNTVKVRWRIRGLSSLRVFTQFWKLRITNLVESMKQLETWHDGISTYYLDANGSVYRHVVDKMMPDDETIPAKDKSNMATKLAA